MFEKDDNENKNQTPNKIMIRYLNKFISISKSFFFLIKI